MYRHPCGNLYRVCTNTADVYELHGSQWQAVTLHRSASKREACAHEQACARTVFNFNFQLGTLRDVQGQRQREGRKLSGIHRLAVQ